MPTTVFSTLSLHDALPIFPRACVKARDRVVGIAGRARRLALAAHGRLRGLGNAAPHRAPRRAGRGGRDRKSTRLNSSHVSISYAVFCLKKKTRDHDARTIP